MTEHLFVYGTLMRGEERDGLVAHLSVADASVNGRLWRVPAGYPALQLTPDGPQISGELLTLDQQSILMVLDLYEGVGEGLYERREIDVYANGTTVRAWVYVMTVPQLRRSGARPLKTTDWRLVSPKR
jgi:gamma-glutamylcyclotransferase (GGCT)/AIG2-like uncharacterized protein YtfP